MARSRQHARLRLDARGVQREQLLPVDGHVPGGLDPQPDLAAVDVHHGDADVFADVNLFAQFAAEYQHGRDSSCERDGGQPALEFYAMIAPGVATGGVILYLPQLRPVAVAATAPTTVPTTPRRTAATRAPIIACAGPEVGHV